MNKENYTILKNERFGRFMVANKDIKAGELILHENPLLIGPQIDGPLICFNCCRSLRKLGFIFCKGCNAAIICSPKCTGAFHTQEECAVFKDIELDGRVLSENGQAVFPLRCLILKKYQPEVWNSMMELEPHLESRRNSPIWRRHKVVVEQCFSDMNLVSEDDLENELVQRICGLLDVNTFEVRPPHCHSPTITNPETQCLRGLYLKAALMAHDCVGNTHLSVDDDFVLRVKASVDIPKYSAILFNYANALHGNLERKQHLREGKYFECNCNRCNDPTELNTELSSLKCHACREGLIRVIEPNRESDWRCSSCGKIFKHFLINTTVAEGRRKMQEIDPADIGSMESLLKTLLQTFHQNHYLVLELKQNMVGEYTHLPPNQDNLIRKIELCQQLVEVFPIIEPGISRMKAIALYQLQSSMIDLAHKQYRKRSIRINELIVKLTEAEKMLKEAIRCFLYDPPKSPEGRITLMALSEMKMLRLSIENIKKDLSIGIVADDRSGNGIIKTSFGNDKDIGPFNKEILDHTASDSLTSNSKNHKSRKNKKKHL